MKKVFSKTVSLVLALTMLFSASFALKLTNNVEAKSKGTATTVHRYTGVIINDFNGVANYIHKYNKLPGNFITKAKAQSWGWKPGKDLSKTCPGYSIGGDVFTNSEGSLPSKKGRVWHECDINYVSGPRNAYRIVFSSDGYIYKTSDHYATFTLMYAPGK